MQGIRKYRVCYKSLLRPTTCQSSVFIRAFGFIWIYLSVLAVIIACAGMVNGEAEAVHLLGEGQLPAQNVEGS